MIGHATLTRRSCGSIRRGSSMASRSKAYVTAAQKAADTASMIGSIASGTRGLCVSGAFGFAAGGVGSVCVVSSDWFRYFGFAETLGGGGTSPTAGIGISAMSSNAVSSKEMGGWFGYANGSVVLGPDIGPSLGGTGSIGRGFRNRTVVGGELSVGVSAKLFIPVSGGAGVSNSWTQQIW